MKNLQQPPEDVIDTLFVVFNGEHVVLLTRTIDSLCTKFENKMLDICLMNTDKLAFKQFFARPCAATGFEDSKFRGWR